jgi:hypothetical protein
VWWEGIGPGITDGDRAGGGQMDSNQFNFRLMAIFPAVIVIYSSYEVSRTTKGFDFVTLAPEMMPHPRPVMMIMMMMT